MIITAFQEGSPTISLNELRASKLRTEDIATQARAILPDDRLLVFDGIQFDDDRRHVIIRVRIQQQTCRWPQCDRPSCRIHSWYEQKSANSPWRQAFERACLSSGQSESYSVTIVDARSGSLPNDIP